MHRFRKSCLCACTRQCFSGCPPRTQHVRPLRLTVGALRRHIRPTCVRCALYFLEMNTFGSKINFAETVQHGQPRKLLKTISLQPQICPCSGGVLSEANASTLLVPSKGTRSATKDEGKLQRAGPLERRMSGDSSSFLILGPDRFKGECS